MRRIPIVAATVVALFALTGCFLLPEGPAEAPAAQLSADDELDALVDRLNAIRGVSAEIDEWTSNSGVEYPLKATISAAAATPDDLKAAIADTWQTLLLPAFADDLVFVEVDAGGVGSLVLDKRFAEVPFIFQDDLATELDTWFEVHEVVNSAVQWTISGYPPQDGGYSRIVSVDEHVATIDVKAIAAIPDLKGGATQQWWRFGSYSSAEVLPNPETVALTDRVEAAIGAAFDSTSFMAGELPSGAPYLMVYAFLKNADINDLGNSAEWPTLRAVVDVLSAPEDAAIVTTLRVQPNPSSGDLASVTLGRCSPEPRANPRDTAFFALLDAAALPAGSAPGECPVG